MKLKYRSVSKYNNFFPSLGSKRLFYRLVTGGERLNSWRQSLGAWPCRQSRTAIAFLQRRANGSQSGRSGLVGRCRSKASRRAAVSNPRLAPKKSRPARTSSLPDKFYIIMWKQISLILHLFFILRSKM